MPHFRDWYVEGPDNELQYWGLDYPPLSAFHSYGLGIFFSNILPESVQLFSSRGFESPEHKFWMRLSVLLSDILLPAVIIFGLFNSVGRTQFPRWMPGKLSIHFSTNCIDMFLRYEFSLFLLEFKDYSLRWLHPSF